MNFSDLQHLASVMPLCVFIEINANSTQGAELRLLKPKIWFQELERFH